MNFNNDASTHARLEVMFVMWKFLPPLSARTMAAGRNICPHYMSDTSPTSLFKTDICSAPCPLPLFFLSGQDQLTRRPGIPIRKSVQYELLVGFWPRRKPVRCAHPSSKYLMRFGAAPSPLLSHLRCSSLQNMYRLKSRKVQKKSAQVFQLLV